MSADEGGRGVRQMLMLADEGGGGGGKNRQNSADIVYGSPLDKF